MCSAHSRGILEWDSTWGFAHTQPEMAAAPHPEVETPPSGAMLSCCLGQFCVRGVSLPKNFPNLVPLSQNSLF